MKKFLIFLLLVLLISPVPATVQTKSPTVNNQSYITFFNGGQDAGFTALWNNGTDVKWGVMNGQSENIFPPNIISGGYLNLSASTTGTDAAEGATYKCQTWENVQIYFDFNISGWSTYNYHYFEYQSYTQNTDNDVGNKYFIAIMGQTNGYVSLRKTVNSVITVLGRVAYPSNTLVRAPKTISLKINFSEAGISNTTNITVIGLTNNYNYGTADTTFTTPGNISLAQVLDGLGGSVRFDNLSIENPPFVPNATAIGNETEYPFTGLVTPAEIRVYDLQNEYHSQHPYHTDKTIWTYDKWCWNISQSAGLPEWNETGRICDGTDRFFTKTGLTVGAWTIWLQTNNTYGGNTTTRSITVSAGAGAGAAPTASFTQSAATIHLDESVTFTDTSSCEACTMNEFNITFVSGATTAAYHQNYTIAIGGNLVWGAPKPGVYSVIRYLQNASGSDEESKTQTVLNVTPISIFSCAPTSGTRPLTVLCTDASTGNFTTWNWTTSDGFNTSVLQNPTFIYTVAGSYDVNLTVEQHYIYDNELDVELKLNYITVTDPVPLVASFTPVGEKTGTAPYGQQFIDTSTGGPTGWIWNATNVTPGNNTPFTFSTSQNPKWWFGFGNYTIALNITDGVNFDDSSQVTWINVSEGGAHECTYPVQEEGNVPVEAMYILVPLALGLSVFAVWNLDNRIYANIVIGGFSSSILWFFLAANVITGNLFYSYSDKYCVLQDTPLFWLFILLGIVMTLYTLALALEAITERNMSAIDGGEE